MRGKSSEKNIKFSPDTRLRKIWLLTWIVVALCCYIIPVILWLVTLQYSTDSETVLFVARIYGIASALILLAVLTWLFQFYRSLKYEITTTHIRVNSGVFWRKVREIPYSKITDVMSVQGPIERLFHVGHLNILTASHGRDTQAEGVLKGLPDFLTKRQEIIGRITRFKSVQELGLHKEDSLSTIVNLLTGILNELRSQKIPQK